MNSWAPLHYKTTFFAASSLSWRLARISCDLSAMNCCSVRGFLRFFLA